MGAIVIRPAEPKDASDMARLFFETVHAINRRDYTQAEVNAWAPRMLSAEEWFDRQEGKTVFVAVDDSHLAGFAELDPDGHLDCFYVHKDRQRRGVGGLLLGRVEARAGELGLAKIYAEVSLTAEPFFAHRGFRALRRQEVLRRGVPLKNVVMRKELVPKPAGP